MLLCLTVISTSTLGRVYLCCSLLYVTLCSFLSPRPAVTQNCDQLTVKLSGMFEECEVLRMESEGAVKDAKLKDRENHRLKQLAGDLGRQVQVGRDTHQGWG